MVCSQGIIGTPSRGKSSSVPNNEHLLRLTLCHESRGILYRTISLGRSLLCYRLDYPPHSHKRKAQRHNFIHWDNEPLLWPQRARCYLLFPVFLCIWWYVRWLQYLAQPSHFATGMCAFGIIIGKYVAHEHPLPSLFPCRRYDPACHPLRLPQPPIRTCPLAICQSTIHNRALHCRCFLSIVTIPRHPQTLRCLQFRPLRHAYHRILRHIRGSARLAPPQR